MELQFRGDPCRCLCAAVRDIRNTELTQEIRLSDGMPDIGRILASWGQCILRSKEWQSGQVTVTGGVMVWVLYAPEDGTQPRCLDAWVPFQLKWETDSADREGSVRVSPLLRFADSRSISARKVMVRVGIAALGEAMSPMEAEIFTPEQLPEDIQILKNTYPLRLPVEAGEKTFLLDEDLTMPAGAAQPERLLAYSIAPLLQEKRVAGDKAIIRGTAQLRVIYRCAEGKIHAVNLEIPLSQYAQLEKTYGEDAQADVMMGTTSLEVMHSDGAQLRLKCGMVAQYLISDRLLAEMTEDAYSTHREVSLQMQELDLPVIAEQRMDMLTAQQSLPGIVGEVADIDFLPDYPRQSRAADKVMVDLPGQFQVLYYATDGSLQCASAHWESNLQIPADEGVRMDFLIHPQNAAQVSVEPDGIGLSGHCVLQMQTSARSKMPMVTGLEVGPERDKNLRPSLVLCRPEGETLWEMAKRCDSTVADICRVNGLSDQVPDERILLIPVK